MKKQQYFERPTRVKEIVDARSVKYPSRQELVESVMNLRDEEAVIVTYPIIPRIDGNGITDWQRFLKRGTEVYLRPPKTRQEALESRTTPNGILKEAFERLDSDQDYCGYVWTGYRSKRRKKVHLVDCLEGAKLFSFSENSSSLENKIEHRDYTDGNNDHGGTFTFKIPSRSSDSKYSLRLQNVPLVRTVNQYAVWTDLDSEHGCDLKVNDFSFRRATKEDVFCAHEIAAYLTLVKEEYHHSGRVMLSPFFVPTESTVNFWNHLRNNTMVQESKQYGQKIRNVKRPLNRAEIEILLWDYVASHMKDATTFTRRKLKDYEWK
jgi:hypothetical protein